MLTQAREALKEAKDDAQAADQRSRELMGLYGWAGITPGGSGRGTKVEIFQDPGSYDGLASKFEEWWMKMNAWLECHPKQFQEKDEQGHRDPVRPSLGTASGGIPAMRSSSSTTPRTCWLSRHMTRDPGKSLLWFLRRRQE